MAADPIQFMLIEDGEDVRPFQFSTNTIQIGCDASRGDNLLIELPQGKRHVRAKIIRSDDYVELEVVGGPIWLMGSRMDDGDVAELNVGDILVFGTKKAGGSTLRFEYAKEAEIVIDDVADWSVAAAPKKKRGKTAEDDMLFEEEVDPTAGMNPWQKAVYRYREQYKKFAAWRKKSARIKYWISLGQLIWAKGGQTVMMLGGFAAIGGGWYLEAKARMGLESETEDAEKSELIGTQNESAALAMTTELKESMRQCGCGGEPGPNMSIIEASEAIASAFADPTLVPERAYPQPDKDKDELPVRRSIASIVAPSLSDSARLRSTLDQTIERTCSARGDKERLTKVREELQRHELHEAYSFIPFGEPLWCDLSVSTAGGRGTMDLTPFAARAAFDKAGVTYGDIGGVEGDSHRAWLKKVGRKGFGNTKRLLAKCPLNIKDAYRKEFYGGEEHSERADQLDPSDPRTDWATSVEAGFAWLDELDAVYADKGFREADRVMLALAAYRQGPEEVQLWIDYGRKLYKVEKEGALTYPQVYGGAIRRLADLKDKPLQFGGTREAMDYPSRVLGRYLYTKPRLPSECLE